MFSDYTKEAKENSVEIKDISFKTLRKMLHFLYTGNVTEVMVDHELLTAADKYQIVRLGAICENTLARTMNIENCMNVAIAAYHHGTNALQDIAIAFVTKNWLNLSQNIQKATSKEYPMLMIQIMNQSAK